MRFFAAELVRETALEQLEEEVPYSVACEIEEFREGQAPMYIRAVLYVERDSQKAIVIGDKGARIRSIGVTARAKIETLVDAQGLSRPLGEGAPQLAEGSGGAPPLRLLPAGGMTVMTLAPQLLEILVCPKCRGALDYRAAGVRARLPRLPPPLRGARRDPDHADRRGQAAVSAGAAR